MSKKVNLATDEIIKEKLVKRIKFSNEEILKKLSVMDAFYYFNKKNKMNKSKT